MAANGFSRYCAKHRRQFYLTRSPTGRILRKGRDLKRYRDMAAEALVKHREHPAFQAAFRWLESLMDGAEHFEGGGGVRRDLAAEFRRLRRDGATGEAMFLRIAAVWGSLRRARAAMAHRSSARTKRTRRTCGQGARTSRVPGTRPDHGSYLETPRRSVFRQRVCGYQAADIRARRAAHQILSLHPSSSCAARRGWPASRSTQHGVLSSVFGEPCCSP